MPATTPAQPDQGHRPDQHPTGFQDLASGVVDAARVARETAARGEVAHYIPPMAAVKPDHFALTASEIDGTEHTVGEADEPFAIQSISKVFSLVLALREADAGASGEDALWCRVGREPSGTAFNSMVQLEHEQGIPRNPMINAGALVVDDMLLDHLDDPFTAHCELLTELCGEEIGIDEEILHYEQGADDRNRALAHLMADYGNLRHEVDDVLAPYTAACAISMTSSQLARASRFLANDGIDPITGRQIISAPLARRVAALMLTCGTYDAAGEFAFSVGMPCKSGVAGAIIALVPDRLAACVWSPPLDGSGNSVAGRVALHELAERCDLSIF